jgi:hypothetical protein
MKTSKIILALSLALIFAIGITALHAQGILATKKPIENKANYVTYVVRVVGAGTVQNHGAEYLVMMTDETGREVAPSQAYRPGISDYTFTEGGTVRGTRVARMVRMPVGPKSYGIRPNSRTGVFYGGTSYLFMLIAIPAETDGGTGSETR